MSAKPKSFTDRAIKNLRPRAERYDLMEPGRTGLGVRVSPHGTRTFFLMYKLSGRTRRLTIGRYPELSLADARVEVARAKQQIEKGEDPGVAAVATRQEERDATTVAGLVDEYLERWARPRKRSWREDERALRKDVLPAWGSRKAKDIKRRDVSVLLDSIVSRGAGIQANRSLAVIKKMFNFAISREIGGIEANPCQLLEPPTLERQRTRVLNQDEITTFWWGLDNARMARVMVLALRFLLATSARKSEAAAAPWSEIDLDDALWIIDAERFKSGRQHTIPLNNVALGVLAEAKQLSGDSPWVFPSPRADQPIGGRSLDHAVKRNRPLIGLDDVVIHDLRRTCATHLPRLGVSRFVIARVLGHSDRTVTGLSYDLHEYGDEKRDALDRWGAHLEQLVGASGNVVAIHGAN